MIQSSRVPAAMSATQKGAMTAAICAKTIRGRLPFRLVTPPATPITTMIVTIIDEESAFTRVS